MRRKVTEHVDSKLADLTPKRFKVELKRLKQVLNDFEAFGKRNNCGDDSDANVNGE